jgi:hypothetical protein
VQAGTPLHHPTQIGCNLVSFGVLEPDYIEWTGIADALSTMQIAAVEAVKQVGQSRSVWTIFIGLKRRSSGFSNSSFSMLRSRKYASFWISSKEHSIPSMQYGARQVISAPEPQYLE